MTTEPLGEAKGASNSPYGTPEASLGSVADKPSLENVAGESQSQASGTLTEDGSQALVQLVTPEPMSASKHVPVDSTESKEITSMVLHQAPGALQTSTSFQNPPLLKLVNDAKKHYSQLSLQQYSLVKEERSLSQRPLELAPPSPNVGSQPEENTAGQPALDATALNPTAQHIVDAHGQPATEQPGGLETLSLEDSFEDSPEEPQVWSFSSASGSSAPPSPAPRPVALGRRLLDPNLYMADEENNYMRSMTSLLGGGEGSISSLADILVWSETTIEMATGFLGTGHSSVTDLLQGTGPSLRSASSILGSASSAFSSGLTAGTGSALRSLTHMLETFERRTIEGIRSAVRFLTSHLTPHRDSDGPNCD
ncbi:PREDICTED: uncharacterized protein C2orf57 homolog [Chrysochloris asiatica]|uniref:Uncharacterized protein C2orf57 homolog n=1 Tax=Chrysochloris asiatica TaxID=185453 RepID=A0A9B0WR11_CHRAS|nr:PREDICTED: uncharacterized protein C2orf57 homolog [Chrysochloris asiatica]